MEGKGREGSEEEAQREGTIVRRGADIESEIIKTIFKSFSGGSDDSPQTFFSGEIGSSAFKRKPGKGSGERRPQGHAEAD